MIHYDASLIASATLQILQLNYYIFLLSTFQKY